MTDHEQGTPPPSDIINIENREWRESLDYVYRHQGPQRVVELLRQLQTHAQEKGVSFPYTANTPYINTIGLDRQPVFPGSRDLERRIKSIIRWNAMAMVVRANKQSDGIGGHISTYASSATLFEVGFNHFFHARTPDHPGDATEFWWPTTRRQALAWLDEFVAGKEGRDFQPAFHLELGDADRRGQAEVLGFEQRSGLEDGAASLDVLAGALQAAGRTADALSAVASAGGTPPPPIPTKVKTSK